jgi:hypothetical protein
MGGTRGTPEKEEIHVKLQLDTPDQIHNTGNLGIDGKAVLQDHKNCAWYCTSSIQNPQWCLLQFAKLILYKGYLS